MLSAKENFIKRINTYSYALSSEDLISKALTEIDHNERAKFLRNGLAIIGFTILEDFIKKRTGEVFKKINSTSIPFPSLPSKIQEAATSNALKSIQERAKILKGNNEDWIHFIQSETRFVASTLDSTYELSEYSLGWEKPNLSADDISKFLSTFNVDGGWNGMQSIIRDARLSLQSADQAFTNAARRRHNAAHNSNADSLLSELIDFGTQVKLIAFSYDSLISKSLKYILDNDSDFISAARKTNASQIKFRYIIEDGPIWKEYSSTSMKAVKTERQFDQLFDQTIQRARRNHEILVKKKRSNQLLDWYIAELM